jgi:hypothetical protein
MAKLCVPDHTGHKEYDFTPNSPAGRCIAATLPERVQRTSSNLRGLGETFRQCTKPSHGGRVTSAGAPKAMLPSRGKTRHRASYSDRQNGGAAQSIAADHGIQ